MIEALRLDLANIGVAIVEERGDQLLLQGTANKRKASVFLTKPKEAVIAEVKRQLASNSGSWPEEVPA